MNRPSEEEINSILNECIESEETGSSKFPGMSYEQGVKAAIMWMLGEEEDPLID